MDELQTPLAEGMGQLHEMFLTLVSSGFTERQACQVVGVYLAELVGHQ